MVCINNVNAFKLAGIVDDRCIANLPHFSSAKISSLKDYIKPTLREFGPEHVILDVGTNNLNLPLSSSNINEVIRAVFNFVFFYEKILYAQRAQKAPKSSNKHQKHKKTQKRNQAKKQNANKRKKIKNMPQKHLSGKK